MPAYYQLGMWRVQYLQKLCCLCQTNDAVISAVHINPKIGLSKKLSKLRCLHSASLLCEDCHNDTEWLSSVFLLDISRIHTHPIPITEPKLSSETISQTITLHSSTLYQGYVQAAIIAFKYNENLTALPVLVHAIRQLHRPQGHHAKNSVILPMPTTNPRLRHRGFDPVSILAHYLSKHWCIPLWNGVSRVDNAVSQQGLSRNERRHNIQDAFQIEQSPLVRHVIIFDDVLTTGSTLKALAACLKSFDAQLQLSAYTIALANRQSLTI